MSLPRAKEIPQPVILKPADTIVDTVVLYDQDTIRVRGSNLGDQTLSPETASILATCAFARNIGVVTVASLCELRLFGSNTDDDPEAYFSPLVGELAHIMTLNDGRQLLTPSLVAGGLYGSGWRLAGSVRFVDHPSRVEPRVARRPLGRGIASLVARTQLRSVGETGIVGQSDQDDLEAVVEHHQRMLDRLRLLQRSNTYVGTGRRSDENQAWIDDRIAQLARACTVFDEPGLQAVLSSRPTLRRLAIGHDRETGGGGSLMSLAGVVRLFARDVAAFTAEGVYQPLNAALYHRPEIVAATQAACLEYAELFSATAFTTVIDRFPVDPLGGVRTLVERHRHLRDEVEPRLRAEFDFAGTWSANFIWRVITASADPEAYLRTWFDQRRTVQEAYPDAGVAAVDKLMSNASTRRLVVATAESAPQTFNFDEAELNAGAQRLEAIRRVYASAPSMGRINWTERELARQIRHNAHLYDGVEINELRAANYLRSGLRHYNRVVESDQRIADDLPTVLALFANYARDIQQFRQMVSPALAELFVSVMSPDEYQRLDSTYRQAAGLSPSAFQRTIRSNSRNPEPVLRQLAGYPTG